MKSDYSLQTIEKIIAEELNEHIDTTKLLYELIPEICALAKKLIYALKRNKKVLLCGNGGSSADAQHFAAELICKYETIRKSLAAISLSTDTSAITSISNDLCFEQVFSRQIEGLGLEGDVLIAISTSGKSKNILNAIRKAKEKKIESIALLGKDGGEAIKEVDFYIKVNSSRTSRIQEMHGLIIHIICGLIDKAFSK